MKRTVVGVVSEPSAIRYVMRRSSSRVLNWSDVRAGTLRGDAILSDKVKSPASFHPLNVNILWSLVTLIILPVLVLIFISAFTPDSVFATISSCSNFSVDSFREIIFCPT